MDSSRRRRFLQTVAGVSTIGLAGCSQFSGEQPGDNEEEPPEITDTLASTPTSTPVPVPDDASFGFDYSGGSLTIRLTGGGPIPASNLVIRSSEGTQVRWYELGSTAVPASGSVTSGDTATIASSVLNWPNAVEESETIRVLFMIEGSPTTLETYEPATEETPTETPVGFVDDFDYPSEELSDKGWIVENQDIGTTDSYLLTDSSQDYQWAYHPVNDTGNYNITGVKNEDFDGLRIALTTDTSSDTNYYGYQIIVQGVGRSAGDSDNVTGEVFFARKEGDSTEILINNDYQHNGEYHDYEIERDSEGQMRIWIDGDVYGTVTDQNISEIEYIGVRFDGTGQRFDRLQYEQ